MDSQIQKSKLGRPPALSDEVVRKLEAALMAGFSITIACHVSGISRSTFYEHKALNKEFSDKMKLAEEFSTYKARLTILKAIDNGDVSAAKFWLERKCRVEFAPNRAL